ncbi:MAG: polysaccharide deacetylase family protein [Clostridia bacterium]|nr:polysaccharide deacetylase family protein [Clostridia bacterium]
MFKSRKTIHFFIITKKQIMFAVCILLSLVLVAATTKTVLAKTERKLPIYSVETDKKRIAISFDAAWGNDDTETLIKALKQYDVPATFFVVGAWVDKYPESVMQISNAGHQIQNHSNTHPRMTNLSKTKMADEINTCNEKIKKLTGVAPTLFRPPYGDYDNMVVTVVEENNMKAIQWSVDSLDWQETATADSIYNRVTSKVKNGSIVLFHNDAEHTPEALPRILDKLKKDGYEFVFISDLIYKDNYEIRHDGTQCKMN